VLIEPHAKASLGQHTSKRGLANLKRPAQVVAVDLDQVKGIEEYALVRAVVANEVERCHSLVVAGHRLPIDDAGVRAQPGKRLGNQREAASRVIAGAAVEPHVVAILAGDNPEAIVLDFVQPLVAGGQLVGPVGRHGAMNPAGKVRCRMWAK
jgi:hypothetical protein